MNASSSMNSRRVRLISAAALLVVGLGNPGREYARNRYFLGLNATF